MAEAPLPQDLEVRWIPTAKRPTLGSKVFAFATFQALGNRVDVDTVGVSDGGVTFVRKTRSTMIPWAELIPSKMQYGRGYIILMAKDGTAQRGGPWVVSAEQGLAILRHRNWTDPEWARVVTPKWLA
ncbi:MAG: hypothetical protein L3K13_07810 [Thermoplasmata archaeon]|nr:hypothetical protein [Thermoplasmata archaeon]